ncbi:MBL fold metallo-hydrolase [Pseudodesulfovibrio sediminis]|uniref:MBL fold metallo-hydrolase n=1 Tax=Pseudodesulfovibrio sediminis TaxID=2810563 RepID=A0ABM7P5R3_9BACT|nr:MBL fold metallo-hydrolase [Pseudodesulfovibrio sediminis]BCS88936.1 MBL fold metallo-hydrolase [Pseudodesulfovibrio sediminis]
MELTFLVDNSSRTGTMFLAEPALSMFIQDEGKDILFDAGYSDAFLKNAQRKGIDLLHLNWVALSHGHFDHTWGLDVLIRYYYEAATHKMPHSWPKMLAHPKVFASRNRKDALQTGMLLAEDKLASQFAMTISSEPYWLTEKLVFLGEVERVVDFEPVASIGERMEPGGPVPDNIPDDTGLAYVSDKGLVVIAGCAHVGICNTIEKAKKVTGIDEVNTVLGGFHLQEAKPERLDPTTDYLAALNLEKLYACHCTDLAAKIALARKCPVLEAGSGLTLEF